VKGVIASGADLVGIGACNLGARRRGRGRLGGCWTVEDEVIRAWGAVSPVLAELNKAYLLRPTPANRPGIQRFPVVDIEPYRVTMRHNSAKTAEADGSSEACSSRGRVGLSVVALQRFLDWCARDEETDSPRRARSSVLEHRPRRPEWMGPCWWASQGLLRRSPDLPGAGSEAFRFLRARPTLQDDLPMVTSWAVAEIRQGIVD